MLSPTENISNQDFSSFLSDFPVLFKADLIFKDFSRKPSNIKYFSSLVKPCNFFSGFCQKLFSQLCFLVLLIFKTLTLCRLDTTKGVLWQTAKTQMKCHIKCSISSRSALFAETKLIYREINTKFIFFKL